MKRGIGLLAMLAMIVCCSGALAEIGFAEVKKGNVNVRRAPGAETFMQLDAPQSVYVFEEEQRGEYLWCHVNTNRGKNCVDGWIRSDMLRFLSEEFCDVVSVQAGSHYATGVRSDGTVAIMGNDMPHSPCIETVRTWRNAEKTASHICSAYALCRDGRVLSVGRSSQFGVWQAADLSGEEPVLLDEQGYILEETWKDYLDYYLPQAARGVAFKEVATIERVVKAGLTKDGKLLWFGEDEAMTQQYPGAPYTDIDMYFYHLAALRADGRVDAAIRPSSSQEDACPSACNVGHWENVVQVAAGVEHTLGLKRDGTVYYAGDDARHRAQVENWRNVVQIDAGNGFSIALMEDGSVAMAGEYRAYLR